MTVIDLAENFDYLSNMNLIYKLERVGYDSIDPITLHKTTNTCGRQKNSDIVCMTLSVSRRHCQFTVGADGVFITDLGSSNGVFVNGYQIPAKQPHKIVANDLIGIGCNTAGNIEKTSFVYKLTVSKPSVETEVNMVNKEEVKQENKPNIKKENKSIEIVILDDDEEEDAKQKPVPLNSKLFMSESSICNVESPKRELYSNLITSDSSISSIISPEHESNYTDADSTKSEQKKLDKQVTHNALSEKQEINLTDDGSFDSSSNVLRPVKTYGSDKNIVHKSTKTSPEVISDSNRANDVNGFIENGEGEIPNIAFYKQQAPIDLPVKQEPSEIASIQQEIHWGFSQTDVSEINNSSEDFPASQLFDKTHTNENDLESDYPMSSLVEEDDNIITIVDSDEENDELLDALINPVTVPMPFPKPVKAEPASPEHDVEMDISLSLPEEENTSIPSRDNNDIINDLSKDENIQENAPSSNSMLTLSAEANEEAKSLEKTHNLSNDKKRKQLEIIAPHHEKPKKEHKKNKDKSSSKKEKHDDKHKSSSNSKQKQKSSKSTHPDESNKKKELKKRSSDGSVEGSKGLEPIKKKKKIEHNSSNKDSNVDVKGNKIDSNNENQPCSNDAVSSSETTRKELLEKPKPKGNVKVKVTSKNRFDMLTESFIQNKTKKPTSNPVFEENKIPKSSMESLSNKKTANVSSATGLLSSFVIPRRATKPSNLSNRSNHLNVRNKTSSNGFDALLGCDIVQPSAATTNEDQIEQMNDFDLPDRSDSPPSDVPSDEILSSKTAINGFKKKVAFKENIASVKEFPVEPGNQLKNIKAGISGKTMYRNYEWLKLKGTAPKVEDFLSYIFSWEPIWLEQQKQFNKLPPIVKDEEMIKLPSKFETYDKYYKNMEVLLLLESWQQMFKEFECDGRRYLKSHKILCTMVKGSLCQMKSADLRYTSLNLNVLTTKKAVRFETTPVYGDLIILEFPIKQNGSSTFRKAFGYIKSVQQKNPKKLLESDKILKRVCGDENPDVLLTYEVQTRIIDESVLQADQLFRLRSIMYIRPNLRMIQALQFLPQSALNDVIMKVEIDDFQLDRLKSQEVCNYKMITEDKLNEKQSEAVIKFTNAAVRIEPKIGLLMGPPGTGKSKVIANLVTEILYGEGRYVTGKAKRILLCAPSNAAVDELVLRLLEIRGAIPAAHRFKMVRIGQLEAMHKDVKNISLTELSKREAHKVFVEKQQKSTEEIQKKKARLKDDIQALEALLDRNPLNEIYKKNLLDNKQAYNKLSKRSPEEEEAELLKYQAQMKTVILTKANVIACTLSSCFNGPMEQAFGANSDEKIPTCIVDEATQSCEAETLIPLMLGIKTLILVGDPNQLPATVVSTEAKKLGLDRSLFTRLRDGLMESEISAPSKTPMIMLNTQYRMVSSISYWPNKYFYSGKLLDEVTFPKNFPIHPYRVLNLDSSQDPSNSKYCKGHSNTTEAEFIGNLINCIMTYSKITSNEMSISIGVVTPYQSQKTQLEEKIHLLTSQVNEDKKKKFNVEVNTIDSFQGQERDVIIMSCVRSSGIGFVSDPQRLCVALTRAKMSLIICGNFRNKTFQNDKTWKELLVDARSRGLLIALSASAQPQQIKQHVIR